MNEKVKIMGIVNINGDSFYAASRVHGTEEFCSRVRQMLDDGADIIDIGACSSRLGSTYPGWREEWRRLRPVLKVIRRKYPSVRFSIDTFSSRIVRKAYRRIGHFMVNDIYAGEADPEMLRTVAELGLEYVAMHNRDCSASHDIAADVAAYFKEFEKRAEAAGVTEWILDPGFGFGKDVPQNLELLERLPELHSAGREILVGISRKRMTYQPAGLTPEEALDETCRLHKTAIEGGALYLRVHDVAQAKALLQ